MKKLGLLLVVLAGCARGGATAAPATGGGSPEGALSAFVAAAKAQDLQAMSNVWGDSKHLVRENQDRASFEKRELIIIKLLCQDSYRVAGKSLGTEGRQILQVEMKHGAKTGVVKFTTVRGIGDRWYVEDIDTVALQEFCSPR